MKSTGAPDLQIGLQWHVYMIGYQESNPINGCQVTCLFESTRFPRNTELVFNVVLD